MPGLVLESEARQQGFIFIAGLDEAGRGALAGPVVAAAVILPLDDNSQLSLLEDVDDSKRLTSRERERLVVVIKQVATAVGVGSVSAPEIDSGGIIPATREAMGKALQILAPKPEFLLIDGRIRLARLALPQQSIIRGDSQSLSIAAASIVAKVHRDRFMIEQGRLFPGFGFARNKGYGTAEHLAELQKSGPCPLHRRSFRPLRSSLL